MKKTLLSFFLILPCVALSQQYIPDASFGNNGIVTTLFDTASNDLTYDAVETPDGKLILAGQSYTGTNDIFSVVCLNSAGELDNSFGVNGKALLFSAAPGGISDAAKVVRLLPNAKILVGGESGGKIILAQLNDGGSYDQAFGVNGYTALQIGETSSLNGATVEDMAIQEDGKIILAVNHFPVPDSNIKKILVLRFNADGNLDTTFGIDGAVYISTGTFNDTISAVRLQTDGKIVGCGTKSTSSNESDFMAFRLNADGSLDNTFDVDGIATVTFALTAEQAKRMEIQPDGKILLAGNTRLSGVNTFGLTRLNVNGSIDTAFGNAGKAYTNLMSLNDNLTGLKMDPPGNIYLSGSSSFQPNGVKIVKYNSSGIRVNAFGGNGNGIMIYNSPSLHKTAFSYWSSNGNLGIGGAVDSKFAINYFTVDGNYNTLISCSPITTGDGNAWNISQLPDGKYIASGGVVDGTNKTCIIKYHTDGTLDTTFGNNGIFIGAIPSSNAEMIQAIQPDGKILFATHQKSLRVNPDGTLDTSYGNMGFQEFPNTMFVRGLKALPDGKMLVSGLDFNTFISFVTRQNQNGTIDLSFGINGYAEMSATTTSHQLLVQDDGKILLGGFTNDDRHSVSRYLPNGMLDPSFGLNGNANIPFNVNSTAAFGSRHLVITPEGKIIVSGLTESATGCIIRLNSDGSVDTTYAENGRAINTDYFITACNAPGNKTIHGGKSIARYDSNGVMDMTFGDNGKIELPGNPYNQHAMQVLMQPDGKLMVAYDTSAGFVIARYGTDDLSTTHPEIGPGMIYINPNPVESQTQFMYTLKTDQHLTIQLFDMRGKLLRSYLHNQWRPAGQYDELLTIPQNLSGGNYILRISSENGTKSIKLIKK